MTLRSALLTFTGALLSVLSASDSIEVYCGDRMPDKAATKEGYNTFRIPALLRAGNGDLLAFAEARRDGTGDGGKIDMVVKRSGDAGKTWSALSVIYAVPETPGKDGKPQKVTVGNAVPILAKDGTIHLLTCVNNRWCMLIQSSTDHGRTWTQPRAVFDEKGNPGAAGRTAVPGFFHVLSKGFGVDVQTFATGPGHGICLADGRLLVPVWLSGYNKGAYPGPQLDPAVLAKEGLAVTSAREPDTRRSNGVLFSDDNGATWRFGGLGPEGSTESVLALRADGGVVMNARFVNGTYRTVAVSTDRGEHFTGARLATDLIDVSCQGSLLDAVLPDGRSALIFCNPAVKGVGFSRRAQLTLRLSTDGGETWPHALEVDAGPSAYSDLCRIDDATIGVLFERGDKEYHERIAFRAIPFAALLAGRAP